MQAKPGREPSGRRSPARRVRCSLVLSLVLAGCGSPGEPPAVTTTAGPTSTSAATSAPASPPVTVVSGTVRAGSEAGCLLLDADGHQYLLLGGDPQVLTAGARVVVEGRSDPGRMTTCQQGVPFHVDRAIPAP